MKSSEKMTNQHYKLQLLEYVVRPKYKALLSMAYPN